jgi:2-polyprenyl-3-methyl-5-hydroxy-6-metoxy-1,4-benzoquinol methylase
MFHVKPIAMLEQLTHCPLCHHTGLVPFLAGKDFFLTQESFGIVQCEHCGFRFTNPRPEIAEAPRYYQADNYLSHEAETTGWFSFLYRLIRASAIKGKYRLIRKYVKGLTLLDIGCGTGEFIRYCRQKGMMVTGIEPERNAREIAQNRYHLHVMPDYLDKLPEKATYHCITLWHVLEHVYPLEAVMQKLAEEIHPSGMLILALPNCKSGDARYYREFWAAYDLPRHVYHFTPEDVVRLAHTFGWEVQAIHPMKWDAFYIAWMSETYKRNRFAYVRAIFQGLRSTLSANKADRGWSSQIYLLSRKKT